VSPGDFSTRGGLDGDGVDGNELMCSLDAFGDTRSMRSRFGLRGVEVILVLCPPFHTLPVLVRGNGVGNITIDAS
jgi:hypothetical protein